MPRAASLESGEVKGGEGARERILAAALAAFAEKGYDGASNREIAARADVNLGLLQYYFGGKPKLWRAAVDRAFAELRSALAEVLDDPRIDDDRERLRLLIRRHVGFVGRNPEFVRIMHDEGKRRGPRMRWLVDHYVRPSYAAMESMIERFQASGFFPADIAPIHFLYVLVGSVDVIFHQAEECRRLSGVDPADEAVIENHARAVEHLFLGASSHEQLGTSSHELGESSHEPGASSPELAAPNQEESP